MVQGNIEMFSSGPLKMVRNDLYKGNTAKTSVRTNENINYQAE